MKMTRENFPEILTPIHSKHFFNAIDEKPLQYSAVCTEEMMNRNEDTEQHEGGFGLWDTNTEGNAINEDEMHEGDTVTYTAGRIDKGYEVTWEMVQDDQANLFKNVLSGKGKNGGARMLGRGYRATIETAVATVYSGGFANTGYDGAAMCSNSHTSAEGATLDNLTTGALTATTLKAGLTLMRNQYDETGEVKVQCRADQLIVAGDNEWNAHEILESSLKAQELSNTKNVLPKLNVVILDYLPTAAAAYWWLRDSSVDNVKIKFREKVWFDSQPIPKTVDWFFFGFCRYATGYSDFRGIVGSAG